MVDDKLKFNIYKVDFESSLFENKRKDNWDILVDELHRNKFKTQELKENISEDFTIEVFYKKENTTPEWKVFFKDIIKEDSKLLTERIKINESFVMLIYVISTKNIYVVSGGVGYFAIKDFIDDNFGIDIISRLMNKSDRILRYVKEKNITGGILGESKFFRLNYNLNENEGFGKIYEELMTLLDKKILIENFGFIETELKKPASCIAKASFRINKDISIKELFRIIRNCEKIYRTLSPIQINSVKKINRNKHNKLTKNLDKNLLKLIWDTFRGVKSESMDICHKEFDKYLTAENFAVEYGVKIFTFSEDRFNNLNLLFNKIRELDLKFKKKDYFEKQILYSNIFSYDEDNNILTKDYLIKHIMTEIDLDNKKYFIVDGNWYVVEGSFIDSLNDFCNDCISNNSVELLDKTWDYENDSENKYNQKYINENNFLVLDKITPENIELCDILKWDENNLYLFHVKSGFNQTTRDLVSQIFISSRKLNEDKRNGKKYLNLVYDKLLSLSSSSDVYYKKASEQTNFINKNDFLSLFDKENIVYVFSILDTASQERKLIDGIENFNSSIAKFSLQELVKNMRAEGFELKIQQIFKP